MYNKFLSLLLILGITALFLYNASPELNQFRKFKQKYGKVYKHQSEQKYRQTIFNQKLIQIREHNSNKTNTYWKGVNQFSDLTSQEFTAQYSSNIMRHEHYQIKSIKKNEQIQQIVGDDVIDWVADGKVPKKVKNQGTCGACYAFAANAAVECAIIIKRGLQLELSQQQIVDCTSDQGNDGCKGGDISNVFEYIKSNGVHLERDYPYVGVKQDCQSVIGPSIAMTDYRFVPETCQDVVDALRITPLAVAIDQTGMQDYQGGIFQCQGNAIKDAVLLVGYSPSNSKPYWTIKRSLGPGYGEGGYMKIANNGINCGICLHAYYPT